MTGPLTGTRVVELAAQGPGPFACMLLADLGAEVVSIERVGARRYPADAHSRGRRSVAVNIKDTRGRDVVLDLIERSDVMVEGYRPGVAERLGLGPEECLVRNPRLVYGRMTGWGQDGPLATSAGHDLNYLALSGALHAIGESGHGPVPPLNLVADYGGGGMLLALGITAALLERAASGRGQVIDAAMVDGVALLLAPFLAMAARGSWSARGTNLLDGGAHFYRTYETSDGKWVSVGAIEPRFYREFLRVLGLAEADLGPQMDRNSWPSATERVAAVFATRTREEWTRSFEGVEACVQPVLELTEATAHPHAAARGMFVEIDGAPHPRPAPRFSRTTLEMPHSAEEPGTSTCEVLTGLGLSEKEIVDLRAAGVVA
ncbi:CaiB/BaiF CoA transferase family protein [Actinomadura sp. 6N118]|uniref:CaiB/BaiF CoA transferase family protein n=1 Tax=Actinomadura sp. 6N118 TaxID=3375151 RepID=UPI0037B32AB3